MGTYVIEMGGTYHLERTDAPGAAVPAELISPSTLTFTVDKDTTTQVRFLFKLAGSGAADVGFSVDDGGYLSGTLHFAEFYGPSDAPAFFRELVNKDVPFTISYPTATIIRQNSWEKELRVETGPISIQFGGPDSAGLTQYVAPALNGQPLVFSLSAQPDGRVVFSGFNLMGRPELRFELRLERGLPFTAPLDSEGYPLLRPFQFSTPDLPGNVRLLGGSAYGDLQGWLVGGKGAPN